MKAAFFAFIDFYCDTVNGAFTLTFPQRISRLASVPLASISEILNRFDKYATTAVADLDVPS